MGMTIDRIIKKLLWFEDYNEDTYCGGDRIQDEYGDWYYKVNNEDFEAFREAADYLKKYQMMKANYEARLRADMVAMLTEIQLEIEEIEMDNNYPFGFEPVNKFYEGVSASSKLIQKKINTLKGEHS